MCSIHNYYSTNKLGTMFYLSINYNAHSNDFLNQTEGQTPVVSESFLCSPRKYHTYSYEMFISSR